MPLTPKAPSAAVLATVSTPLPRELTSPSADVAITTRKADRSTKLPDPPLLTDSKDPYIDDWLSKMRNKLDANDNHYPTEKLRIAYVETRVTGEASKHLAPRLHRDSKKPFASAEEIFEHLYRIYGDPNRKRTALSEFRRL